MTTKKKACEFFLKLLKEWKDCAIDAKDQFGGILVICNLRTCDLNPFKIVVGIILEGKIQGFK